MRHKLVHATVADIAKEDVGPDVVANSGEILGIVRYCLHSHGTGRFERECGSRSPGGPGQNPQPFLLPLTHSYIMTRSTHEESRKQHTIVDEKCVNPSCGLPTGYDAFPVSLCQSCQWGPFTCPRHSPPRQSLPSADPNGGSKVPGGWFARNRCWRGSPMQV